MQLIDDPGNYGGDRLNNDVASLARKAVVQAVAAANTRSFPSHRPEAAGLSAS